jgi:hypothetical protein
MLLCQVQGRRANPPFGDGGVALTNPFIDGAVRAGISPFMDDGRRVTMNICTIPTKRPLMGGQLSGYGSGSVKSWAIFAIKKKIKIIEIGP